ncbi:MULTISPECIES: DUF2303 family protein [Sorangium]|uniref:DUF2303 domain-containing protein n=1 Tax=Sorangium cellulosum TaxID=56 RepID=A0A4P2QSD8_SORCE|nr:MULTISPECIES: DUF2303 family protein [Sorangium]AUX33190.1 uncharacterized protein SOCE836_053440 [Sorangium cellulosum]AUX33247.1 uncharacterized protein SOCE836_054010 [Sorangium cellulosum]WCQ92566.1 hypothetical protein NQZ70_05307 [Sorangium sp. Soce836]
MAKSDAEAVIELAQKSARAPERMTFEDIDVTAEVLVLPDTNGSYVIRSIKPFLDEYRERPERRRGTARLGDLASFIDHTNRFKDDGSALFASDDPAKPHLMSVLDYHEPADKGDARFGEHRAICAFPLSEEWVAWKGAHGKPMTQQQFAEFLETRIVDVVEPVDVGQTSTDFAAKLGGIEFASPLKLLQLSRGMSVRVGATVKQAVNLSTGEVQVHYETQHSDDRGEPLRVPTAFVIAIPVFRSGVLYKIPVRLRYSVSRGDISWRVELHRADIMMADAFDEAKLVATKETGLPLFVGSPES